MMRILSFLAIASIMAAGCSQQPGPSAEQQDSQSDSPPAKQVDGVQDATKSVTRTPDTAAAKPSETDGAAQDEPKTAAVKPASKLAASKPSLAGMAADPEAYASVLTLLDQMGSEATMERRAASEALDALGEAGMPAIVRGLREGNQQQRRGAAVYLIGRVSPRDADSLPALTKALADQDTTLRHAALQAIEKTAPAQLAQALPALITFARNTTEAEAYRSRAIRAIGKLGQQGSSATAELIELARKDPSTSVRRACFFTIYQVAPRQEAEQFFQEQLKDDSTADQRRLAAKWLARVTTTDRSLACLIDALHDEDKAVRLQAVDSLVAIGKPALPVLVKALDSPNVVTRRHATLAIGKLGVLAATAVPALTARLKDPDSQVRELAKAALKAK